MINDDNIDRGLLQISLTAEGSRNPIADATVQFSTTEGRVFEELKTDSSGQTAPIQLPAPPLEYSIVENEARPYSLYNITVLADGFETLHVGGVQILPNSLAIQDAELEPFSPNGRDVRNLFVGAHTLWGDYPAKIPETEVKPLPDFTGFVVLPEPVIPEYMIVHRGLPLDNSAPDVWVPFKDYIKNVASSEIYSTWAPETMKANVLAIISFALNRVYTEWYRGKGYPFTITSSTAFDQSFRYGGTIYDSISMIVDDIFTNYITKENIVQPLFTQYCDGRRTQCSGLSQWGSQALGEQGMDAITILKHYYGWDIYLASAQKVEGVPQSYGGVVLQVGSEGRDVGTIQYQLNAIAAHYPAIPLLKVDSVFGINTRNAVSIFQGIFHLPQTGAVDFATWYSISDLYVGVSKIA